MNQETTCQLVTYNQAFVLVLLVTFSPSKSSLKAPHRDMTCCGQFSGVSWLSCGTVRAKSLFTVSKNNHFFGGGGKMFFSIVTGDLMVLCVFPCWFLSVLNDMRNETPIFGLLVRLWCVRTCACVRLCKWETWIMSLEVRESKNTGTLQMGFIERKWQGPLLFSILHIPSEKSGCDNQTVHS